MPGRAVDDDGPAEAHHRSSDRALGGLLAAVILATTINLVSGLLRWRALATSG